MRTHHIAATGLSRSSRIARAADYASFMLVATAAALRLSRPDLVLGLTSPPQLGLSR